MVAGKFACDRAAWRIWFVRNASGIRRQVLRVGPVPFPVLLAADRRQPSLVETFPRAADSRWTAQLPRHLLLLSQSLLPSILRRSPVMRGRRATAFLQR